MRNGGGLFVTLNRPKALNSLTTDMIDRLYANLKASPEHWLCVHNHCSNDALLTRKRKTLQECTTLLFGELAGKRTVLAEMSRH